MKCDVCGQFVSEAECEGEDSCFICEECLEEAMASFTSDDSK